MKIFVLIVCFFIWRNNSFSQVNTNLTELGHTKLLPMQAATVWMYKPVNGAFADGNPCILIKSKSDSIFSNSSGIVLSVFSLNNEMSITIKYSDDLLFTYAGIDSIIVSKGEYLNKGSFIGFHKSEKDIFLMINKSSGAFLNENKIWALIKAD